MNFERYSAPLSEAERVEFVPFVHALIGTAFSIIRPLFIAGTEVITKGDATPVTEADRGAEAAMRKLIEARFPLHGILGEEFGETPAVADTPRYRWVLDPVDGTRAFITHCFLFGTLIALERWVDDGVSGAGYKPILGAIAFPAAGLALIGHRDETRLYATDGSERAVRVRDCTKFESATVLSTTHWSTSEQRGAKNAAHVGRLTARAKLYRTWGDCFGYFAVATGGADVMLDPVLAYWDVAAIIPVVEGAGGQVTSWEGGDPLAAPSLIATAGPLHPFVLAQLHGGA
jgi:myo-inositol-1(or 4)-monophosphatase